MIDAFDFFDCEYIVELTEMFLKELNISPDEIELDVALVSESNFLGYSSPHGIDGNYIILIDDDPSNDIIHTLAHECVHIHQFYSGDLKESGGEVFWNGTPRAIS